MNQVDRWKRIKKTQKKKMRLQKKLQIQKKVYKDRYRTEKPQKREEKHLL